MDLGPLMGAEKWGIPDGPASNAPTALASVPAPSATATAGAKHLSLSNPLAAFGILGAVTFGLMAFSTSVRVGKATAGVNLGKV